MPARMLSLWRAHAIAIVTDPDSTIGQRRLAWAFLRQHRAAL
jgi:hypothetical protein